LLKYLEEAHFVHHAVCMTEATSFAKEKEFLHEAAKHEEVGALS
jgi:hypothetical protein